jgi:hypothetical protein
MDQLSSSEKINGRNSTHTTSMPEKKKREKKVAAQHFFFHACTWIA